MRQVHGLSREDGHYRLRLSDGSTLTARTVVIATGATYRRLGVPALEDLQGRGVFYGAGVSEAPAMRGRKVFVAGGGNSAGQAAMHLAKWAEQVTVLVRARVAGRQHVRLPHPRDRRRAERRCHATASRWPAAPAPTTSSRWCWRTADPGRGGVSQPTACSSSSAREPRTEWLGESVARDQWGFILTGQDVLDDARRPLAARPPATAA